MKEFVGAWFGIGIAVGFAIGALSVLAVQWMFANCYSSSKVDHVLLSSSPSSGPAYSANTLAWYMLQEQTATASNAIVVTTHGFNTSTQAPAAAPGMGPLAGGQHRWKNSAPAVAAPDTLPMSDTRPKALPAPVKPEHVAVNMVSSTTEAPRTAPPTTTVPPTAAALSALSQQQTTQVASTTGDPFLPAAAQAAQPPAAPAPAPSAGHQRGVSSASVYDVDDLDSEWKTLLDNVGAACWLASLPCTTHGVPSQC
jgi:hypothetical protein